MKQGTANLAEDYCFIHKALRPVSKARRQIAAVPPSNSRPAVHIVFPTVNIGTLTQESQLSWYLQVAETYMCFAWQFIAFQN